MTLSGYDACREELTALAAHDGRVVCLAAAPAGTNHPFELAHPDRFFALPRASSAMVEVVSGLVTAGFRPFVCTGPGHDGLGTAGSGLGLLTRYLEAGATVVSPFAGFLEEYPVLRRLADVTLAVPCGDVETRAVVREAAVADRPFHIRVGSLLRECRPRGDVVPGAPVPVVGWEASGAGEDVVCLVSVGEDGAGTARAVWEAAPWHAHARLVYLDDEHLRLAAEELGRRYRRFVVTGARGCGAEGVAEALARLLPGREVTAGGTGGARVRDGSRAGSAAQPGGFPVPGGPPAPPLGLPPGPSMLRGRHDCPRVR
ncbi:MULTISPECIES: transketolase [unclassified Streptomyces]|uniref:transketolase n=1 Tax=unclassified Streptomyces TaxID=2593676 RepID=UPI000AEB2C10|nr:MULTISPECIES: transketolase [unclassified Streptomyces]